MFAGCLRVQTFMLYSIMKNTKVCTSLKFPSIQYILPHYSRTLPWIPEGFTTSAALACSYSLKQNTTMVILLLSFLGLIGCSAVKLESSFLGRLGLSEVVSVGKAGGVIPLCSPLGAIA